MRLEMRTLVERASRWLINNRRPPMDSEATVDFFERASCQQVIGAARPADRPGAGGLRGARRDALVAAGVPEDLAAGSRCSARRTACSASSRPPSATTSTHRGRPGALRARRAARAAGAGGADPGAAARGPLADDGARGAARRPALGARPAHRAGAGRDRPEDSRRRRGSPTGRRTTRSWSRAPWDARRDLRRRPRRPGAVSVGGGWGGVGTTRAGGPSGGQGGSRAQTPNAGTSKEPEEAGVGRAGGGQTGGGRGGRGRNCRLLLIPPRTRTGGKRRSPRGRRRGGALGQRVEGGVS